MRLGSDLACGGVAGLPSRWSCTLSSSACSDDSYPRMHTVYGVPVVTCIRELGVGDPRAGKSASNIRKGWT